MENQTKDRLFSAEPRHYIHLGISLVIAIFFRFLPPVGEITAQGMAARMNVSKSRQELADDAVQAQFEDSVRRLGEKAAAGSTTAGGASSVMGPAVVEGASVDGTAPAGDVELVGDVELAGEKEAGR